MSRDSSRTHLHLHHPRLADHFESFLTHTPSNTTSPTSTTTQATNTGLYTTNIQPGLTTTHAVSLMSSQQATSLPNEDVIVPPHLMPENPEDEEDVTPEFYAAFGIRRAMGGQGPERREAWRDWGLNGLLERGGGERDSTSGGGEGRNGDNARG